jgi:glycosyltransferase involved in cell wall biosynthesis
MLSPAVLYAAKSTGKPVVMTVHNYRQYCAAGNFMRHGVYCQECYDLRSPVSAVKSACYRNSMIKTLPIAVTIAVHQRIGTWRRKVDAFIAQTDFQRDMLINGGIPWDRVWVKPHFAEPVHATLAWEDRKEQAVFVGRLSQHKGVRVLLNAWRLLGRNAPQLHLVGGGPESAWIAAYIEAAKLDTVIVHGHLSEPEKTRLLTQSKLLVMPTLWLETFGLVLIEAFACGVPVLASRIGSIGLVVREGVNGALFPPGDERALADAVRRLWVDRREHERLARGAAVAYKTQYSPEVNYQMLHEIYSSVLGLSKREDRYGSEIKH